MKKQLLSILLCLIMVVGLLPTAALAEEAAPTFDLAKDLVDIKIPDDLVTCVCTKAGESKSYGQLPGGFSASQPLMEDGSWTVLIYVEKKTYLEQFSQDIGSPHTPDMAYTDDITTSIQFKLKYTDNKWKLLGEMPQGKMLHFTCGGGHVYQGDIPVINLRAKTDTRILVTENRAWEYSIDNGANWQGSCLFKDLSPGTKYTIIARVKETATHKPSANSAPLTVTTMHLAISGELKDKLRAVASAYEGEYNGKEHEAVIVETTKLPTGWTIDGYTTDEGASYGNSIPKIKDAGTLRVGVKFVHPDYLMNITHYYTAEITPKPVTAGMIADIPPQHYTGNPIHPTPEIKDGNTPLVKDKDFTYSYDTNTSPEHGGTVTITGNGNYKGMASKNFSIVNEITEITEDDLKDLEIPTLVTVKCTTTNSSKEYGRIPGGFDLSKSKPYMDNGVLKAIVYLNLPAYKAKYDADTKKTHENAEGEGNPHAAFTLKYVKNKWELDGSFPAVVLLVTCNGSHENQTYTVTFDGNGGVPSFIRMDTIDQKLSELPTATHSGRYSFDGWYTEKNGGTKITTATLFDKDTTVYAHWTYTGSTGGGGVTTYPITVKSAKNGDVTASHKSAAKGTTITLTVDPDKGYVLDTLTVLDGKDKDLKLTEKNGKFTFTMPASKVTVEGSFKEEFPDFPNPFSDIAPSDFCCDAVMWAVAKDITNGIGNYTFAPNQPCTRAQIVTFLWRAAGSPAPKSASNFTDVPADAYYAKAVAWAVENGITGGTGDGKFSPDATCTRAQAVTFLYRASGSPAVSGNAAFTDVAADAYYAAAVTWAEKNGITGGIGGGLFGSGQSCTRGQIVTFLYRARNK